MRAVVLGAAVAFALMGSFATAERASAQTVYDVTELSERPRIASPMAAQRQIQAAYPRSLQSAGVQGRVVLQLVVLADGSVDPSNVEVAEADHDALADAARTAVRQIKFVPGEVNGAAVATRVLFPITFTNQ